MIRLTDEEINQIYISEYDKRNMEVDSLYDSDAIDFEVQRELALAQACKMYEWFRSKAQYCRDKNGKGTDDDSKVELREFLVGEKDWQSLREELGL